MASLRDFITNPPGSYTRQTAARYAIIEDLQRRYKEALTDPKRRRRFDVSVSKNSPDVYTVWVRVPSSKYLTVTYDVVFEISFEPGMRTVLSGNVRMFSNAMSWAMTYGYVAASSGLLIPGWAPALGRAATEQPKITNPTETYGFDRIVSHAIFFLGTFGLVLRSDLDAVSGGRAPLRTDPTMTVEAKLALYQQAQAAKTAEDRAAKLRDTRTKEAAKKAEKLSAEKKAKTAAAAKTSRSIRPAGVVRSTPLVRGR